MAAAGVDASNTGPEARGRVLVLPRDPDAQARTLRSAVAAAAGASPAVLLTDTSGRPWRVGQTDFALGCAGLRPTDDLRGGVDADGAPLHVTVRAVADELAAAAELVKGKAEGVPAALVRGAGDLVSTEDGPGASGLVRFDAADWFATGTVESVRAALGCPAGTPGVEPALAVPDGDQAAVLARAVQVVTAGLAGEAALAALAPRLVDGGVEVPCPAAESLLRGREGGRAGRRRLPGRGPRHAAGCVASAGGRAGGARSGPTGGRPGGVRRQRHPRARAGAARRRPAPAGAAPGTGGRRSTR